MSKLGRIYALNAANLAVLTVAQILIVPFYLHYLGVRGFEKWTFINAVGYISLICDFGLIYYTCNSARIAYSNNDREAAEKIVGQAFTLLCLMFVPFTLCPLLYYILNPSPESLALAIMLFSIPITMIRTWLYYVLTARTSQIGELVLFITFMFAQTIALILVTVCGGGIVALATAQTFVIALFGVLPAFLVLRHHAPELRLRPRKILMHEIRPLLHGSLINFSYSGTSTALVYLPILLLGVIPGLPVGTLATFTTSRTLTGVVRQFCQQLARSNVIEISRYLAHEHGPQMRRMFLLGSATISVLAAFGMGGLLPMADQVLNIWTGKPQLYNMYVIGIFCIWAVMSAQVQLAMILPQFTNTARVMVVPLVVQVCMVVVLGSIGAYFFGATGMVIALAVAELTTLGAVSLRRIIPSLEISPVRFLVLTGGPGIAVFTFSALISALARMLVHPSSVYGLVLCGILWAMVMLPTAGLLYRAAKRYQWN